MNFEDLEATLPPETKAWLATVMQATDLSPTHYRLLSVLREVSTSPSVLAHITGMQLSRVRQRLKELKVKGLVTVCEELSDRTQIWGLVGGISKPDTPMYPTEATIQERRSRQVVGPPEYSEDVRKIWAGPDGVVRPRDPAKVDRLDPLSLFKQYEAKANK